MPARFIPGHTYHTERVVGKSEPQVHKESIAIRPSNLRAYPGQQELSICTNKTCKKQGSLQVVCFKCCLLS